MLNRHEVNGWWNQSSGSLAMFSGTCSTTPSSTLAEYYIAEHQSPYLPANRQSNELRMLSFVQLCRPC
jgi:hypothetical protein